MEQSRYDLPIHDDWLSERELLRLRGMRFAKRRADWRLGRWTAKLAIASYLAVTSATELRTIEILPAAGGYPEAWFRGEQADLAISLSHRAGVGLCCLSQSDFRIGCDLETIESRSDAFVSDYFTEREQATIQQASERERPLVVALLWSAKESVLKALHQGLRLDTKSVEIRSLSPVYGQRSLPWQPLTAHALCEEKFFGWWRTVDDLVWTLVSTHFGARPQLLDCLLHTALEPTH